MPSQRSIWYSRLLNMSGEAMCVFAKSLSVRRSTDLTLSPIRPSLLSNISSSPLPPPPPLLHPCLTSVISSSPSSSSRPPGLHGHHLPAPALERLPPGLPRERERERGRPAGLPPLDPRHLHPRLQTFLPARRHGGEPPHTHLQQRHGPLRSPVNCPRVVTVRSTYHGLVSSRHLHFKPVRSR